MKISQKVRAEDVVVGDYLYEGEVLSVTDNYENVECVDITVEGEDEPMTFRGDDTLEIFIDVA